MCNTKIDFTFKKTTEVPIYMSMNLNAIVGVVHGLYNVKYSVQIHQ